jgi:hypothetical protein
MDDNGDEIDRSALVSEDLEIKKAKYGKFDPSFHEKLNSRPAGKTVNALIAPKKA